MRNPNIRRMIAALLFTVMTLPMVLTVPREATAVVPLVTATSGSGFYQGDYASAWLAKARHGGAGGYRAILNTEEVFTGGTVPWPNGRTMHVTLDYDSASGDATITVEGALAPYDPVILSDAVPGANGRLLITGKTSFEAAGQVVVANVALNGVPVGPDSGFVAQGSDGTREVKHLLIDGVAGDFVLTCDVAFTWGSNPRDEGPALQFDVEDLPVEPPTAAFTADVTSGMAPLTASFTDQSTGAPDSWAWDFDNDGAVDSTDQYPSHVYTAAGIYSVRLTVTNGGGSDDETKTDYITVTSPVPDWDLNGDHVCNIGDGVVIGLTCGQTGTPGWIPEDVNNDGVVNIGDGVVIGLHWGETW